RRACDGSAAIAGAAASASPTARAASSASPTGAGITTEPSYGKITSASAAGSTHPSPIGSPDGHCCFMLRSPRSWTNRAREDVEIGGRVLPAGGGQHGVRHRPAEHVGPGGQQIVQLGARLSVLLPRVRLRQGAG